MKDYYIVRGDRSGVFFGRKQFVQDHNLSLEKDYTVKEFINLTKNDYGGDVIKELAKHYK